MAINFKSVGHFFAKAFAALKADEPKIAAGLQKVEGEKTLVEGVTAAAGAGAGIPVEEAAFAVLGAISAFLTAGGDASAQKLTDLGLDTVAIQKAQDVLKSVPQLVTVAKSL